MKSKKNIFFQGIRNLLLHFVGILIFLMWDYSFVLFTKTRTPWWVYISYNIVDISFFYSSIILIQLITTQFFKHSLFVILTALVHVLFYTLIILFFGSLLTYFYNGKFNFHFEASFISKTAGRGLLIFSLIMAYLFAKKRIIEIRLVKEKEVFVEQAKAREVMMENALLRAQINPHFLFNCLNGVYIRMLKKVPEDAGIVLLLAEMMDYSLVNTQENAITTIAQELQQLNRLLKLYQFLNNDSLQILYDFDVSEQAKDTPIIPLLFFNLTENIFKHGKLDDPLQPASVKLVSHSNGIEFTSSNFKSNNAEGANRYIGLSNTRNRLHLHYPDNHELSILETEDRFEVRLIISL